MKMLSSVPIMIRQDMTAAEQRQAVEAAALAGFHSISAVFPVCRIAQADEAASTPATVLPADTLQADAPPDGYIASSKSPREIFDFDWRRKKGLETLAGVGIFGKDRNLDLLPDTLEFRMVLPEVCSTEMLASACDFAYRLGMETTAFTGPVVAPAGYAGDAILWEGGSKCGLQLTEDGGVRTIHITGDGAPLQDFIDRICNRFPVLPEQKTWVDILQDMTDSLSMNNLDGQLAYCRAYAGSLGGPVTAYCSPQIQERRQTAEDCFPDITFRGYKDMVRAYEHTYDIPWEVDVLHDILKQKLYPQLSAGDRVEIRAALSEEQHARSVLTQQIREELTERGAGEDGIRILCAYKQGFSWIDEDVLPRLAGRSGIRRVVIYFRPFLPEGQTDWLDEDGAMPKKFNLAADSPDKWYDLADPWLQELYPIEDSIATPVPSA